MGTRGLTPVAGLVMGSAAMKVVQVAAVPVTLVK
jgi:nucleotide-binding universal stress UspA family protein